MKKKKIAPAEDGSNVCFTIMPFGSWFDSYYEEIYVRAIQAAGLVPRRADDLYRPSAIVHDIWALTTSAKLLLADLTGKNPNVFYELGLAHAIAKPVILVAESIEDVPFDLRALRVITYEKNEPNWGEMLSEKIRKAITQVLATPLDAVLPTFLRVKEEKKSTITVAEKEILTLRQDLELLRREIQESFIPRRESMREGISKDEADTRIARYIKMGLSEPHIVERMGRFGVNAAYVTFRLSREKRYTRAKALEEAEAIPQPKADSPKDEKDQQDGPP